ncbi:MAG: response regulator [Chloroflexi bacterium]|nr:response regulator [Chloroflexota bacterium]
MNQRILVVDDEPAIGKVLRMKLRLHGYEVVTTTSGTEAVDLVRTQQPDLVLLDLLMPGVSGMDVLERVRTFSRVPIIVFTGMPDIIQLAMKRGASDSIAKPFDPDQLMRQIEILLGNSDQTS